MKTRETIFEEVKKIIVEQLEVKEEVVIPEAKFVDDLGTDSLDRIEMAMSFEEQFNIKIPDDDSEGLITVQDVLDYIQRCLKEKAEHDTLYPTYSI